MQAPENLHDLLPGHPVSIVLIPARESMLRIDLRDSVAQEILLQTAGPDVTFQVLSDGIQIQQGVFKTAGWMAIPLVGSGHPQLLLRLSVSGLPEDQPGVRVWAARFAIPLRTLAARTRAARLYSAAQEHCNSLRAEIVRQAIDEYQAAAAAWRGANDPYGEAIALGGVGESQSYLSQYSQAAETLRRAIVLGKKSDYVHAWLLHLKARAFLDEWETSAAKRSAEESLSIGSRLNDPALIAEAFADSAEAGFLTRDKTAHSDAEESLSMARSSGLPVTAAFALRTLAWMEEDQGRISRALALMAQADALFRQGDNSRRALETAEDLTTLKGMTGDRYAALSRHIELEPLSRNSGNLIDYGILLENIGDDYAALNRDTLASVYYQKAERAYSRVHFRSGDSLILGRMCLMERSDLTHALKDCTESLSIATNIGDQKRIAIAMYRQGLVYSRMAEVDRDLKKDELADQQDNQARDILNKAAAISRQFDDNRAEAFERIALGEVLDQLGRRHEALHEFDLALRLSSGKNNVIDDSDKPNDVDVANRLEALYHIARWYSNDGQYAMAKRELNSALEQIEASRKLVADSTLQAAYFAAERKCFDLGVNLWMQEYRGDPTSGADGFALETSEKSRARGLLDALNAPVASGSPEDIDLHSHLLQLKSAVDKIFDERLRLMAVGGSKHDLEANASELRQSLGALQRVEDEAYAFSNPDGATARTMTAAEIKEASKSSGLTYFEYALGETQSYLWVIDQGVLTSHPLPRRKQIEMMVKNWRAMVTTEGAPGGPSRPEQLVQREMRVQQLSAELSCALLADYVQPRMKRLIIVPDGDLVMLPFTALPENACSHTTGAPLVAEHEIALTPSLSVFLTSKASKENRRYKGEVAVVADPVFDQDDERILSKPQFGKKDAPLPRLLNTGFEAKAIQDAIGADQVHLALGFDASLNTVLGSVMQDYRIWHLATHGLYDERTPEFSGLVFSLFAQDGRPIYGFLKAQDIAHMRIHAELVVLSACDSGAGEKMSGEGVMGLSYSFLRAGAKDVISTLWSVDDRMSKELMAIFYQELMHNGNDAAGALRKSQLTVMHRHKSSSPYYWAGFDLTSAGY